MVENHYRILDVGRDASLPEIEQGYRDAVRRCHPDLHPRDPEARAKFLRVQVAFEVLSDPEQRERYKPGKAAVDTPRTRAPRASRARHCPAPSAETIIFSRSVLRGGIGQRWSAADEVSKPAVGLIMLSVFILALQVPIVWCASLSGMAGALAFGSFIPSAIMLTGGISMIHLKSYQWAATAAVIALILGVLCPPVLPIGACALDVVVDERVKSAFRS